jgi:hypothetical protein
MFFYKEDRMLVKVMLFKDYKVNTPVVEEDILKEVGLL